MIYHKRYKNVITLTAFNWQIQCTSIGTEYQKQQILPKQQTLNSFTNVKEVRSLPTRHRHKETEQQLRHIMHTLKHDQI